MKNKKKTVAYRAMLSAELASTKTTKLAGPLSEVARIGPTVLEVSQRAGNKSTNATSDPVGTKRSHPATTSVRMKLAIRQNSRGRMGRLSLGL